LTAKKKIVFILNPISGTRKKARVPALLEQHLNPQRYSYEIAETDRPFHAHELAKAAAEAGTDIVVAVGGDGTVNEVAAGLLHSDTALGILPFGSGNGLARHLGIPLNTIKAIQLLNTGKQISIDAAVANGKAFFCTAGLGFDARIGQLFAHTHTRGFVGYMRLVLREYFNYTPQHYVVKVNEEELKGHYFALTFANAAQYGNGAYIAPQANIQDGQMDLCLLKPFSATKLLQLGLQLFTKSIDQNKLMQIIRTDRVEIECPGATCMHLDGEFIPVKELLRVQMLPESLQVIVPKT
jgi:diacylglycerol kinase (ATP)